MRSLLVVVVCCAACNEKPAKTPPASSTKSITYALLEATGELRVTSHFSVCDRETTSATIHFALPTKPDISGARFDPSSSSLDISANVRETIEPRVGSELCSGSTRRACPSNQDKAQTFDSTLSSYEQRPAAARKPAPSIVIPLLQFHRPQLCDNQAYDVPDVVFEAKPITVDQLRTGRFVLEGDGTAPISLPTPDTGTAPESLSGTFSWSYRLVFQAESFQGDVAAPAPQLTTWGRCSVDEEATDVTLAAALESWNANATTIPLTPSGCRRLDVTRSAEGTTIAHVVTLGTQFAVDDAGVVTTAALEKTRYVRELRADAIFDRVDGDGDGFFEATNVWAFAQDAGWLSQIAEEVDPMTKLVLSRFTTTPGDAGVRHVRVEALVNGALALVREFDTPEVQPRCFPANAPTGGGAGGGAGGGGGSSSTIKPCTDAQAKGIRQRLARISKRGNDCLAKSDLKRFDYEGKGLTLVATDSLNLLCDSNPAHGYGAYDPEPGRNGKHDLVVNLAKGGSGLDATLFHELLHADGRFHHDDALDTAAYAAGKLNITDRTYACEALCYGASPDACTCIRCTNPQVSEVLNKDVCTKCEAKYGSTNDCAKRYETGADGKQHPISSAVAAWCGGSQTLCDTKAECDSQCVSSSGRNCMPIRATCDDTCN